MKYYYLTLSNGCYSDYSATHYFGEKFVSEEEFKAKGFEIGDELITWFNSLTRVANSNKKYSFDSDIIILDENREEISKYELENKWTERMVTWLKSIGYQEVELGAEINIEYGDIPSTLKCME